MTNSVPEPVPPPPPRACKLPSIREQRVSAGFTLCGPPAGAPLYITRTRVGCRAPAPAAPRGARSTQPGAGRGLRGPPPPLPSSLPGPPPGSVPRVPGGGPRGARPTPIDKHTKYLGVGARRGLNDIFVSGNSASRTQK